MTSDLQPDPYPYPTPKLPLFSIPPHLPQPQPEPSGTRTPPLHTTATVPFRWEQQPGKPFPCTDLIIAPTRTRTLELPPRLAIINSNVSTKTCSPTTVLDGPGGKSVFSSASFRFSKERRRRGQMQGSFDSSCSDGWSPTLVDDNVKEQQVVDDKSEMKVGRSGRQFGSFRMKIKSGGRKAKAGVFVSPLSDSMEDGMWFSDEKMMRESSLSKHTRSHFWATIYEGFKQVVPWRKKPKKESFTL